MVKSHPPTCHSRSSKTTNLKEWLSFVTSVLTRMPSSAAPPFLFSFSSLPPQEAWAQRRGLSGFSTLLRDLGLKLQPLVRATLGESGVSGAAQEDWVSAGSQNWGSCCCCWLCHKLPSPRALTHCSILSPSPLTSLETSPPFRVPYSLSPCHYCSFSRQCTPADIDRV